jgi:hypothetical protein
MKKKSKFGPFKDNRSPKVKAISFIHSLLFWKGRKKGMIHTRDITWKDVRSVFFPKNFYEKYHYLGSVPWKEESNIFKAMEPLVIFMDYKARPWWCPRFVLRFLHLFGDDNSIVRVRNLILSNLKRKLTKGYMIWDYKTKWHHYDLRISISGTDQMQNLANSIEHDFYSKGRREDLVDQIKNVDPNTKYNTGYTISMLENELERIVGERP